MTRRLPIAPLVVGALVAALVGTLIMPSPSSEAFWSARTTGGSSAAQATTVQRVGTPTTSVATQNDVTVSWPAATLSDGTAVTGYVVRRTDASGSSIAATGGCAGTVAATSCVEADVPDGRWTYSVVARFATSWVGPASAASAETIADTVAPANAFSLTSASGASLSGSTVWFRGAVAGSFRVSNAVTDALSGPASSSSGAVGAAGWSHVASSVTTPSGGPFVSNAFSWVAGTTAQPDVGFSGFDVADNVAASTLLLRRDDTAPTGGAISYANGTVRTASASATTASVPVTTGAVADAASGVAARTVWRRTAALTGDACGAFGAWSQLASTSASGQLTLTDAAAAGTCVQYRHLVVDAVGNVREEVSANVVKVKPPYASTVRSTPNLMHQYTFDGSGASIMADTPTGSNSGTTTGDATRPTPAAGAIVGESTTSASFDGVDDFVRVARGSIGASFSIELWFQSTQGLTTGQSGHWYHGAGLVDAETPGVQDDFGISLSADGRVLVGIGNPDTTIRSQAGLNDGRWHHVVMTRDQSSGLLTLYVDGVEVAQHTAAQGSRQTLGASTSIDVGRLQTGINHYRGSIDEVALYAVALTPAQVAEHFGAAR